MHSPMQSLGESKAHPKTPCSASAECGGSRSTDGAEAEALWRKARFKSGSGFGPSGIESIIGLGKYQKLTSQSNAMLITGQSELSVNKRALAQLSQTVKALGVESTGLGSIIEERKDSICGGNRRRKRIPIWSRERGCPLDAKGRICGASPLQEGSIRGRGD